MKTIVAEVCVKKDNKILMVEENRKEKKVNGTCQQENLKKMRI